MIGISQTQADNEVTLNLNIAYKPAFIQLISDSVSLKSTQASNVGKMTYRSLTAGYYKIFVGGPGQLTEIKDSIRITNGQSLILNIKMANLCLYDHPKNYVPTCPKNHTDSIIPIVYGLIAERGNTYIKNMADEKVRYSGCLVTDCDPKFYCKLHKIEF